MNLCATNMIIYVLHFFINKILNALSCADDAAVLIASFMSLRRWLVSLWPHLEIPYLVLRRWRW